MRRALVGDPLLGTRGEQVGAVALVQAGSDIVGAVIAFLALAAINRLLGIMLVPVAMRS